MLLSRENFGIIVLILCSELIKGTQDSITDLYSLTLCKRDDQQENAQKSQIVLNYYLGYLPIKDTCYKGFFFTFNFQQVAGNLP